MSDIEEAKKTISYLTGNHKEPFSGKGAVEALVDLIIYAESLESHIEQVPQWSVEEVKLLLSFCPEHETVPAGLMPMFYFSLSSEKDQEIVNRIQDIRNKLPEPPKESK